MNSEGHLHQHASAGVNKAPIAGTMPIAESPPNPTIQTLNVHPKFSLSYLGDREAVRRTEGVRQLPPPFGLDAQHNKKLRDFLGVHFLSC